ncbi:glycoside hydrolase family 26 protein [Paenibacillus ginsengarvi]|uniref:Copper amine oxidase n=1 Tax=Paenibacillus ginsengarvi TaxID=400777 RepID=A0A3B0C1V5_9BACL|nr:glycosyl hydrolase [Paenibacillus ginsengarvi]RKN79130.1 copper amine oxidase [Paenibacillus ginsengarvi]
MRRSYAKKAVIAGLLAAGFVWGWVLAEGNKERQRPVNLPVQGESQAQPVPAQMLERWDERMKEAERGGNWSVAADYAGRKAAYFRSIGADKEASDWYAATDGYWAKADHKDKRFYDETIPVPGTVTLSPYVGVAAEAPKQLAKFEPVSGTYLGMFGIFDWPSVEKTFGRYHPIALTYAGWPKDEHDTRNYFPTRLLDSVKAAGGGAVQIGWEPQYGLDRVKDDEYVRSFARQAREYGIPIFLRYASEMNGAWVPWYDEPAKYIEKFRLMATIMKEEAPNVATVWSPNFWPQDNIDAYYPGDEYVDWVGFSLYSTPLFAGEEDFSKNQIDYFKPLYDKYAHKPIMISEGAVSHYYRTTSTSYPKWAEGQLGGMYGFLPRMFPQVKAMTYFNMAKSRTEMLNGDHIYDMKENPLMYDMYRRLIQSDYFLTKIAQGAGTGDSIRYVPLDQAKALQGKRKLFVYAKLPMDIQPYSVAVMQGGKRLGISYEMPWELELDFSALDPAKPLTFLAYNGKHEPVAQHSVSWAR